MDKKFKKEELLGARMSLEEECKSETVFHDFDPESFENLKKKLKELEALTDDKEYQEFRDNFIKENEEYLNNTKFYKCEYMFIGLGSYSEIVRESELDSFKNFIDGNGSAFLGEVTLASRDEAIHLIMKEFEFNMDILKM